MRSVLTRAVDAHVLRVIGWSALVYGCLQMPAGADRIGRLVAWLSGVGGGHVLVARSCTGADALALTAGVVLAHRAGWLARIFGVAGACLVVIPVNAARIASLDWATSRPALFRSLHEQVWPAVLVLACATYAVAWLRRHDLRGVLSRAFVHRRLRFVAYTAGLVPVQMMCLPWAGASRAMAWVCAWTASSAAAVVRWFGGTAAASGPQLATSRGTFVVSAACVMTPLIAIAAAAALSSSAPWKRRALLAAATVPLFLLLGVLRALVVAVPAPILGWPLVAIHGFFQMVTAAVVVFWFARRAAKPWRRFAEAVAVGIATWACVQPIAAPVATRLALAIGPVPRELLVAPQFFAQGAPALLPSFQIGLFAALMACLRPRGSMLRALAGVLVQVATGAWLYAAAGEAMAHGLPEPHVLMWRAFAVAMPLATALLFASGGASVAGDPAYRRFWDDVGEQFPDLGTARSTAMYRRDEIELISAAVPTLRGCRILKTDLWDEARNTRIMQWAASQGADVWGIDLAPATIDGARAGFAAAPRVAVADVRRVPFADDAFDAIYSMGTVEHFDETEQAVRELARVLKPGGRVILGVPNRHDPFLRPLLVAALHPFGWYHYGYEKSFTRRQLRRMLERAGLRVERETGILFIPGWLRMAELFAETRGHRRLARILAPAVTFFARLSATAPALRRHGYLIATVAIKP